jgi:Ca2+/Na+ antiporter
MCAVIGWRRFSNSTWEKEHQGYRRQVEERLEQLRLSLNYPQIVNRFLVFTLITLLLCTLLFVTAFLLPEDWEVARTILIWQYIVWSVVYCIWALVMVKILRNKIRRGFKEI